MGRPVRQVPPPNTRPGWCLKRCAPYWKKPGRPWSRWETRASGFGRRRVHGDRNHSRRTERHRPRPAHGRRRCRVGCPDHRDLRSVRCLREDRLLTEGRLRDGFGQKRKCWFPTLQGGPIVAAPPPVWIDADIATQEDWQLCRRDAVLRRRARVGTCAVRVARDATWPGKSRSDRRPALAVGKARRRSAAVLQARGQERGARAQVGRARRTVVALLPNKYRWQCRQQGWWDPPGGSAAVDGP